MPAMYWPADGSPPRTIPDRRRRRRAGAVPASGGQRIDRREQPGRLSTAVCGCPIPNGELGAGCHDCARLVTS